MKWDSGIPDELKPVIMQFGSHTRLLAGPGTGKTLTLQRHVAYIINEKKFPQPDISINLHSGSRICSAEEDI